MSNKKRDVDDPVNISGRAFGNDKFNNCGGA